MSKEIAIIKGDFEKNINPADRTVEYGTSRLVLTTFSGGEKRGYMLQLSIQQEDGKCAYVQLNIEQVNELMETLNMYY